MLSDLCEHCEPLPLIVSVFFVLFFYFIFFMNNALAVTSRTPAARAVSTASKRQICAELGPLGQMRKSPACPQLSLTRHVEESLLWSSWLCSRRNNSMVSRMFLRPVDSMHMCTVSGTECGGYSVLNSEALRLSVYVAHVMRRVLQLTFPTTINPVV